MDNLSMLTDLYELSMANGYRQTIPEEEGVFDVFFRKVPDDGSFVICAGLQQVVENLHDFHFDKQDIDYLRSLGLFQDNFFWITSLISTLTAKYPLFLRERQSFHGNRY